jgi:hypothetical protein
MSPQHSPHKLEAGVVVVAFPQVIGHFALKKFLETEAAEIHVTAHELLHQQGHAIGKEPEPLS